MWLTHRYVQRTSFTSYWQGKSCQVRNENSAQKNVIASRKIFKKSVLGCTKQVLLTGKEKLIRKVYNEFTVSLSPIKRDWLNGWLYKKRRKSEIIEKSEPNSSFGLSIHFRPDHVSGFQEELLFITDFRDRSENLRHWRVFFSRVQSGRSITAASDQCCEIEKKSRYPYLTNYLRLRQDIRPNSFWGHRQKLKLWLGRGFDHFW